MGGRREKTGEEGPDTRRRIAWACLACTSFADWSAGRVIEALDAGPCAEGTIVIFVGDYGDHVGAKDHFEKSMMWEAAAPVPMAIRLPGNTNGGRELGRTVGLIDVFPTLIDYRGVRLPPQRVEGLRLRGVLENPGAEWNWPAFTVCEENYFSARDQRHRYLFLRHGDEELDDHHSDPQEFNNLADDDSFNAIQSRSKKLAPGNWAPTLGGRVG